MSCQIYRQISKKANIDRSTDGIYNDTPNRSSHRGCSVRKSVLRNFAKFTGKHLCQSLFFNKVTSSACNFIKKRL